MEESKKVNMFAEIAKRLSQSFKSTSDNPPQLRASVLEARARDMSRLGYEMTEASLHILCEFDKSSVAA